MPLKYYDSAPYFDDYDQTKNYQRILFRPGYSVQARELTQMQTALQAQIDRFGRHVFKEGSAAVGGLASLDVKFAYVKLESTFTYNGDSYTADNYYEELVGTTVTGVTSGITATVVDATAPTLTDPLTIFVKYTSSADDNIQQLFTQGEDLLSDGDIVRRVRVKPYTDFPVGYGSRVSVNEGVFFVSGNFVYTPAATIILEKYIVDADARVVYTVSENIVTSADDPTLTDNALGYPNEAAPGAHRYQIELTLAKQPIDLADRNEADIIQLLLIKKGKVAATARTVYSELGDVLAQRTYEESGNYTVRPFQINIRELLNDNTNGGLYTVPQLRNAYPITLTNDTLATTYGENHLAVGLEPSVAYVNGYRIQLEQTAYIEVEKARDEGYFNTASIVSSYGNYVLVDTVVSLPDINTFGKMTLKNGASSVGTARARAFEYDSGTIGTSAAKYKLYLFDIVMSTGSFADVDNVSHSYGSAAEFTADLIDATLYNTGSNSLLFRLPVNTVQSLRTSDDLIDTLYQVKKKYDSRPLDGAGKVTIPTSADEIFENNTASDWTAILESTGAVLPVVFDSFSATSVTLVFAGYTSGHVHVIAPTRRNLREKIKNLQTDHPVPISSPSSTISLGVTDLFAVKAVYMSANLTTDASADPGDGNPDIKDRYYVDNGQRDNFYDVATIQLKPSAAAPTGRLLIVLDYFTHQPGDYFSVDSYTGQVAYDDIPSFQSSKGIVQLRDVIDFRPTKATSGDNFTGTGSSVVSMVRPTSIITADIQYYLPRIDKIFVDKNGKFGVVKGISSTNPVAPEDPKDAMVLYVMRLGAYTFSAADTIPNMIDNKRYTMRDIGKIEKRVSNLEYYTSLSLLERETAGSQIFDGANVRYKNGFVVDSFYGHNIGAITHPDYSVSMDKEQGRLRPMFFEDNTRLLWNESASSGLRKTGSLLTLNYYQSRYIEQPYSSYAEFVNPYNVFSWTGDLILSPNTDEWKETLRAPDVIIDQTGIYDTLVQMLDASGAIGTVWNEWRTNWTGSTQNVDTRTTVYDASPLITVTDTATTITTTNTTNLSRNGVRTSIVPDTVTTNMGDRVVEVNFVPFIRSRKIYFKASRMKPNTKVYAFFDSIPMADYVTSDTFVNYSSSTNSSNYFNATGHPDGSSNLITDANGDLQGSFVIPNTSVLKFKTGSRIFRLTNSSTNDLKGTETSAETVYYAQGIMNTVENQVVSTRVPQISRSAVNDQRVTVDTQSNTTVRQTYEWHIPLPTQPVPVQTPPGNTANPTVNGSGLPPKDDTVTGNPDIGTGTGAVPNWPVVGVTGPDNAIPSPTADTWPSPDWWWRQQAGFQELYIDPLAQSFIIDTAGGIFATSLDIYFAQKDDTAPVTVQIRTMVNGAPTQTVVPFSQTVKSAADITVSANASIATTFTFESPVYLMQGAEYCFVVMCNSDKHKIYVSELGEYDITTPSYRITKQPYNGVMFKSANASTWTPEQTKDIKFTLRRAAFAQTGTAVFNNSTIPVRALDIDPIQTTNASNIVRVHHKNHGHFAGSSFVTLANVTANSGTALNGIPVTQLNTTHSVISAEIDSYTIQVAASATSSGRGGSPDPLGSGTGAIPAVTATENKTFNVVHPIVQQSLIPATDIAWAARVTTGKSLAGSETPHTVSAYVDLKVNDNTEFTRPQTIVSAPNVSSLSTGSNSFILKGVMTTAIENISPVIDLDRMSVVTIANRIDNPIGSAASGYNVVHNFVAETQAIGGSVLSKYITRKVELNEPATALNIFTLVNKPSGTGIKLWYKVLASGADTNFETLGWTLKEPDSAIPTSDNPNDFTEAQYTITEGPSVVEGKATGNLNGVEFTAFAVKITFTSENSSRVPTCRDFRAIAIT